MQDFNSHFMFSLKVGHGIFIFFGIWFPWSLIHPSHFMEKYEVQGSTQWNFWFLRQGLSYSSSVAIALQASFGEDGESQGEWD